MAKGYILEVLVVPRAQRSAIMGWHDGALRVRIAATPSKGEANEQLVEFLAKVLRISKSDVQIIGGMTSRRKRIEVQGVSKDEAILRLLHGDSE